MITLSGAVLLVLVLMSFIFGFFVCAIMTISKISDYSGVKQ